MKERVTKYEDSKLKVMVPKDFLLHHWPKKSHAIKPRVRVGEATQVDRKEYEKLGVVTAEIYHYN